PIRRTEERCRSEEKGPFKKGPGFLTPFTPRCPTASLHQSERLAIPSLLCGGPAPTALESHVGLGRRPRTAGSAATAIRRRHRRQDRSSVPLSRWRASSSPARSTRISTL